MLQNIIIGQYVVGNSIIHQLDPRSKLTATFLFLFIVFYANNFLTYSFLSLLVVATILLSRVPLAYIYKGMKPIFILVILMFLLHGLMTKEGELLISISFFEVYSGGLLQGTYIAFRLLLLVVMTTILTLTTAPIQLTDGLENMFQPLKRFNVPVHELALMMSISLRYIPTLLQETDKIMKAQMARGAAFQSGSFMARIKSTIPLLVPLFMQSFRRADELANAMEARAYRGGEGRTRLRELVWQKKDTSVIILIFIVGIILYFLRS